jgi:hypothetical protein
MIVKRKSEKEKDEPINEKNFNNIYLYGDHHREHRYEDVATMAAVLC